MGVEPDWSAIFEESQQSHADLYLELAKQNAKRNSDAHQTLADELPNLLTAADWLQTQAQWSEITQLTSVLWDESSFLPDRGPGKENLPLLEAGLQAARSEGDNKAICARLISLGETHRSFHHIDEAIDCYEEALSLSKQEN